MARRLATLLIGSRAPVWSLIGMMVLLAACSSTPSTGSKTSGSKSSGGFYMDDGPGTGAPANPSAIPDATPRREPLLARANRPYVVFGVTYTPRTELSAYRERGSASWYGKKFHGQKTSSGEVYDMYAMTAAHPTLPIPSFVKVTNLSNGQSVVVRVNDRGPFLQNRLIDLSWTAAARLGYTSAGHTKVEVEQITRFDGDDGMPVRAPPNVAGAPGALGGGAVAVAMSPAAIGSETPNTAGTANAAGAAGTGNFSAQPNSVGSTGAVGSTSADSPQAPGQSSSEISTASSLSIAAIVASSAAVPVASPVVSPVASPVEEASAPSAPAVSAAPSAGPAPANPRTGAIHYVQLAAFGSRDSAEAGKVRLARSSDWIAANLEVRLDGGLYKLQAGPFAQRDEAQQAIERLRQSTELKPFVVSR